nr:MAG TPA: hypothetical protein [Caudoviricetes sp.]
MNGKRTPRRKRKGKKDGRFPAKGRDVSLIYMSTN